MIRTNRCDQCNKSVEILERVAVETHVFHKTCFLCAICHTWLNHFNYCFVPEHDKFYCTQHYQDIESASAGLGEQIRHAMGIGPGVQQQFKFTPGQFVGCCIQEAEVQGIGLNQPLSCTSLPPDTLEMRDLHTPPRHTLESPLTESLIHPGVCPLLVCSSLGLISSWHFLSHKICSELLFHDHIHTLQCVFITKYQRPSAINGLDTQKLHLMQTNLFTLSRSQFSQTLIRKGMRCVRRIETSTNSDPNNRSSANFSILYCPQLLLI